MRFDGAKFEPYIAIEGPGSQPLAAKPKAPKPVLNADTAEYESAMADMVQPEWDHVHTMLDLMETHLDFSFDRFGGHYSMNQHAYINSDGTVIALKQFQDAADARIKELGLDRDLIEAWMAPRYFPWHEEQAWRRQSFEQRMQTFRRGAL